MKNYLVFIELTKLQLFLASKKNEEPVLVEMENDNKVGDSEKIMIIDPESEVSQVFLDILIDFSLLLFPGFGFQSFSVDKVGKSGTSN